MAEIRSLSLRLIRTRINYLVTAILNVGTVVGTNDCIEFPSPA